MKKRLIQISKIVSHILRHASYEYDLELDAEGWVKVDDLLMVLRIEREEWNNLSLVDLTEMINSSSKQRHELKDGKIRALYGHSTPVKLIKQSTEPPEILYHGTSPEVASIVCNEGLKPMNRHYVHLSIDKNTAKQVGYRKSSTPVLLKIRAKEAYLNGVIFYIGNDNVWLADIILYKYIEIARF